MVTFLAHFQIQIDHAQDQPGSSFTFTSQEAKQRASAVGFLPPNPAPLDPRLTQLQRDLLKQELTFIQYHAQLMRAYREARSYPPPNSPAHIDAPGLARLHADFWQGRPRKRPDPKPRLLADDQAFLTEHMQLLRDMFPAQYDALRVAVQGWLRTGNMNLHIQYAPAPELGQLNTLAIEWFSTRSTIAVVNRGDRIDIVMGNHITLNQWRDFWNHVLPPRA